jgi:hypothetical protein
MDTLLRSLEIINAHLLRMVFPWTKTVLLVNVIHSARAHSNDARLLYLILDSTLGWDELRVEESAALPGVLDSCRVKSE